MIEGRKKMKKRDIPGTGYEKTKNKILETATELFALKTLNAVSMRDIANAVGIRAGSIYNYYESKDALMDDIMSCLEKGYRHYIEWVAGMNAEAETLEELIDNLFNEEFMKGHDPMGCFRITIALKEQHRVESARNCVYELFYGLSISSIKADFDRLIAKGVVSPIDTKTISTLIMFCVMAGNEIRMYDFIGKKPPLDCSETYSCLKKIIHTILRHSY